MNTTSEFLQVYPRGVNLEKVFELDSREFPQPWSLESWRAIDWSYHKLFTWVNDTEWIGFSLFSFLPGDETAHLLKICLRQQDRGKGKGEVFWRCCEAELRLLGINSVYLEVEANNDSALGLYRKVGFRALRSIKGFYSQGGDAITMILTL